MFLVRCVGCSGSGTRGCYLYLYAWYMMYSRVAFHIPSRRCFFLDSLLGETFRNFGNRLHSTRRIGRYSAQKKIFWGTYFFSASKSEEEKWPEIWAPKNCRKKNCGKFSSRLSKHHSSLELWPKMSRWGSVSAVPWCHFPRFWLRFSCIFVWWHGHNLTTRHRGTSKVGSFDSEGPSYSTKVNNK